MFDFNKIGLEPSDVTGFLPPATDDQIADLEKYCGHVLPENYKTILKNYNGSIPKANYLSVLGDDGITGEMMFGTFYSLDNNHDIPDNIWWQIKNYGKYMGPNTLPFADEIAQQIFYMKWVDKIPQVWFLAYLDLDEPETFLVADTFDDFLGNLYSI